MSSDPEGYVWRASPYKGSTFTVHLAIGDVTNDAHDYEFWMLIPNLAYKCRLGRSIVSKALATLVTDGFLEVLTEGGGRGKPTHYRFLQPETARSVDALARETARSTSRNHPGSGAFNRETARSTKTTPITRTKELLTQREPEQLAPVERVFLAWAEAASPNGRTQLSTDRDSLIAKALKDYPLDEVIDAVRGWQNDAWHAEVGKNDLPYLLRGSDHIEKFRDMWRRGPQVRRQNGNRHAGNGQSRAEANQRLIDDAFGFTKGSTE